MISGTRRHSGRGSATLRHADGVISTDYSAVNIVGVLKCADLSKSDCEDIGGIGMIAVSFRKLVIDESAARGQLLFRLAESVSSIIVHEQIHKTLAAASFPYLAWRALTE